jgi:ABC-2 type transport system ATP-binding protein
MLQTEKLTKKYRRFLALDQLDLSIERGEIFGLLGPNGSGKSTAIRLLMGFLRPTSGRATVADHDCWRESVQVRQKVAYLPGELRLYENMSGRQLIEFLSHMRGQSVPDDIDLRARRLDIDLDRPLVQLSSGMKRKVALLAVLIPQADLLILDEPTNTLDPTMRDELLSQLQQARAQGQTVLFSSHVLSEVEQVCDRVAILQRGKLVHLQKMKELKQTRLVQARLGNEAGELAALPGLHVLSRQDLQVSAEYDGPMPPLLDWLAEQSIVELRIEPLGLRSIYHRFHGAHE